MGKRSLAGYNRTNYSQRLVDNQEKFSKDHWSLELGIFGSSINTGRPMLNGCMNQTVPMIRTLLMRVISGPWEWHGKNETTQVQPSMVSIYLVRPTSDWDHFVITYEFPDSASPTNY